MSNYLNIDSATPFTIPLSFQHFTGNYALLTSTNAKLTPATATTPQLCDQACRNDETCEVWTFTTNCQLFDIIGSQNSGIKINPSLRTIGTSEIYSNTVPSNTPISPAPVGITSESQCELQCHNNQNCGAYTFDTSTNMCNLFNIGSSTSGNVGSSRTTSSFFSNLINIAVDSNGNVYVSDQLNNKIFRIDQSGTITTIAGTGTAGYSGDGGSATSAMINAPRGITVDSNRDVYFSDGGNNRIRKITVSTGTITTIAGRGTSGYSGDGGSATSAQVSTSQGIAVDSNGNVYISDSNNHAIRKIVQGGTITRFAGTLNKAGYSGDGGSAISALLNTPTGLAVDSTYLYIADRNNNRIRRVTLASPNNTIDSLSPTIFYPSSIIKFGTIIYVAGSGNVVRSWDGSTLRVIAGTLNTAGYSGDGGSATSALLNTPTGLAVDSNYLYIADRNNNRIRRVLLSTNIISTFAA